MTDTNYQSYFKLNVIFKSLRRETDLKHLGNQVCKHCTEKVEQSPKQCEMS